MKLELLNLLSCPLTRQNFKIQDEVYDQNGEIETGWLVSEFTTTRYPIRNFIPRFVPEANYADSFGMQWNKFRQTQLDSFTGTTISKKRFFNATNWTSKELEGKWILDIGCGAGRFAEVALQSGACLVALDYSTAVDACYTNLRHYPNLHVIQGNVYELPFNMESFQYIYSLGVLQHTPDVEKAFFSLVELLQRNGNLCVDVYEKSWKSAILPKYWLRPLTSRISKIKLFSLLEILVPIMLPVSVVLGKIPFIGKTLKRIIPVANYVGDLPLTWKQHKEWALLDTFDWLSPEFDNPQNATTLRRWLEMSNLTNIEVLKAGHLVGRGKKR
jgi:ubiquinone/menaquinone biosynthesis C-methylase UbiE/uncharacterized protein YbaR (Trm112 family)